MKHVLLALLCAGSLSGCALLKAEPWPKAGGGGFAEWTPIADERANSLNERLETLRERNASVYAASDLVEAETLMTRVRREVAGELTVDADGDMDVLDQKLTSIENRLKGVGRQSQKAHT
jgi:hypothetical protein